MGSLGREQVKRMTPQKAGIALWFVVCWSVRRQGVEVPGLQVGTEELDLPRSSVETSPRVGQHFLLSVRPKPVR